MYPYELSFKEVQFACVDDVAKSIVAFSLNDNVRNKNFHLLCLEKLRYKILFDYMVKDFDCIKVDLKQWILHYKELRSNNNLLIIPFIEEIIELGKIDTSTKNISTKKSHEFLSSHHIDFQLPDLAYVKSIIHSAG